LCILGVFVTWWLGSLGPARSTIYNGFMAAKRKTAKEKLHIDRQPELADMPERMQKQYGTGKLLIPTPLQVDEMIRQIPKGRLATVSSLRDELARRHQAAATCPLCTGIFWRLSAEAAGEDRGNGAPWWRLVRDNGSMNEKLPGGIEGHGARLEAEGHRLEKGKVPVDADRLFVWK
jgi:hypothetical protein